MTPEEFPRLFTEGWTLPKPQPFLDYFLPLIHPDATFTQPMFPAAHGHAEIERLFRRLFTLLPDLTAIPHTTAVDANHVYIESDCTTTLGRKPLSFQVCDQFTIQDGKITTRRSYSDPLPTLLATLRRPRSWPTALKSQRR